MALLEVCVDSIAGLVRAEHGGASRIELCSRLDLGGLSPGIELVREARARTRLPLAVMVRPRSDGFTHSEAEIAAMEAEIGRLREQRVEAVVFGALMADGSIDSRAVRRLTAAARPMAVTFHRAFDETSDPFGSLEELIVLGVDRVLTSGGAADAFQGRSRLRDLVTRARGRIVVMAGGGVRPENAAAILADSGVVEIHGSVPFRCMP